MIFKLHKIPDRLIFRIVFAFIILLNLKYVFLIFQIPYTLAFVDYIPKNEFYSDVMHLRSAAKEIKNFYDEGHTGFVSDIEQSSVFDIQESIKSFYISQYAVVPSILKNDQEEMYVIGKFEKLARSPKDYEVYKKINEKIYIYKRINP